MVVGSIHNPIHLIYHDVCSQIDSKPERRPKNFSMDNFNQVYSWSGHTIETKNLYFEALEEVALFARPLFIEEEKEIPCR